LTEPNLNIILFLAIIQNGPGKIIYAPRQKNTILYYENEGKDNPEAFPTKPFLTAAGCPLGFLHTHPHPKKLATEF
jgi:hypothetical protein